MFQGRPGNSPQQEFKFVYDSIRLEWASEHDYIQKSRGSMRIRITRAALHGNIISSRSLLCRHFLDAVLPRDAAIARRHPLTIVQALLPGKATRLPLFFLARVLLDLVAAFLPGVTAAAINNLFS